MSFRNALLAFFLAITAFTFMAFPEDIVHIVQRGETIYSIARSFNIDREELMRINGIADPTKLQAGQRLKIPGNSAVQGTVSASQVSVGREEFIYQAVRGDTLYSLARQHGTTVSQILGANSLPLDYVLKQGDMLRIPGIQSTRGSNGSSSVTTAQVQNPVSVSRPTETKAVDNGVRWPVDAKELSYVTGNSGGVIITGERAEPVKSLTNGTVISAGPYRGYGQIAIVQAAGGYIYVYGGCETLTVKEGDKVGPGMEMGRLGIDAITEKPQLFFRVYLNNTPVDPVKAPRA